MVRISLVRIGHGSDKPGAVKREVHQALMMIMKSRLFSGLWFVWAFAGISLRLVGGGSYYGRVELTHDNHTGTICDSAWSTSDARVVCKYLNFADGDPVTGSYYGQGTGPVMMNGLGCYGYETNIVQCRNKGWMSYNGTQCAKHENDASVVCYKDGELVRFFFQADG